MSWRGGREQKEQRALLPVAATVAFLALVLCYSLFRAQQVQSTLAVFGPQERLKIPQIEKAGETIGARCFQQEKFPFGTCLDIFQPILTQFVQKQGVGAVDDRQEHNPFPGKKGNEQAGLNNRKHAFTATQGLVDRHRMPLPVFST